MPDVFSPMWLRSLCIGRRCMAFCALVALLLCAAVPAAAQQQTSAATGDTQQAEKADKQKDKEEQEGKKAKEKKRKKEPVKFVWTPHPSIRVGKRVRIDFRGRLMQEGDDTKAESGDQSQLDIAK